MKGDLAMQVEVNIVSAFSFKGSGGNKAGVVLDADALSQAQKQEIASKVGLSETAFISKSKIADFKLDFFTPTRQIAHCGHATIASFAFLKQLGKVTGSVSSKETIDGIRSIQFVDGEVFMEQRDPSFNYPAAEDMQQIAQSLGLDLKYIKDGVIVDTGNAFLIIRLSEEADLKLLKPDMSIISDISAKYSLGGYYVYSDPEDERFDATTRMFAPAYGIEEEAATGMAAGTLGAYLYKFGKRQDEYKIAQGFFMDPPSPSMIRVKVENVDGEIRSIFAGGTATLAEVRTVEIKAL